MALFLRCRYGPRLRNPAGTDRGFGHREALAALGRSRLTSSASFEAWSRFLGSADCTTATNAARRNLSTSPGTPRWMSWRELWATRHIERLALAQTRQPDLTSCCAHPKTWPTAPAKTLRTAPISFPVGTTARRPRPAVHVRGGVSRAEKAQGLEAMGRIARMIDN